MADKSSSTRRKDSADTTAPPSEQASDYAGDKEYRDNPDKPSPDSVAQVEIVPEERQR